MSGSGNFAYHPPDQATAHDFALPGDDQMVEQPQDAGTATHDVVTDRSRLGGARALPNLKERGA